MAGTEVKQIVFDFDNDNRPMRESSVKGSLFEPQYEQALRQIDTYLYELGLEKTEKEERDKTIIKPDTEYISDDIDYNNNIFSFIGDRGTGKTSCMISVSSILEEKDGISKDIYPNIDKIKFTTIDLIDPAYFDNSHNLIALFLAKLYKSYAQVVEKDTKNEIPRSSKQEFLQNYRDANSQLHRLYNTGKSISSDEDLMEYVEDVSASVKLKRTVQDLVDAYLACLRRNDTILILRIDDVDMDIRHASGMIEALRKYFVQPNLLVFMSCDLDQLMKIKRRDFSTEFNDPKMTDWCYELADKYFAKVFPHNHRIQMPEPASYHGCKLRIKGHFETEAGNAVDEHNEKKDKKFVRDFVSVKQAVLELILKKTRYLFYNTNYYESYIVPQNLRELRQLMKLLVTMPDYKEGSVTHPHNKTLFKEYFYGNWVQSNLKSDDVKLVQKMMNVQNISLFNKTLLTILSNRFSGYINNGQKESISGEVLHSLPISTADILVSVLEIEPKLTQEEDRKFIFFIKSYYSILLYDSYCQILENLDEKNNRKSLAKIHEIDASTKNPIIRQDPLSEFYDYEKLVGGSFFPTRNSSNEAAMLDSVKFSNFVDECSKLCTKKKLSKEESSKIMLAESLILSIYYASGNASSISEIDFYEQQKAFPKSANSKRYVVNIGALLYNITRYDESLERFRSFHEKIKKSTSYTNVRQRIMDEESLSNGYDWLHRVSLRNFEVLQDILVRKIIPDNMSAPELFLEELKYISTYSFPIYEHPKDGEKHYSISLTFLQIIVNGIAKACSDKVFYKGLFVNSSNESENKQNATGEDKTGASQSVPKAAVEGSGEKKR